MSRSPSEVGSYNSSASISPHENEEDRVYNQVIMAMLDDDPVFQLVPVDIIFDDGHDLKSKFGFDPTAPMNEMQRSIRREIAVFGKVAYATIFARVERDAPVIFVSQYIRDLCAVIRKSVGYAKYVKYDEMVILNREKINKRWTYEPRKSAKDKFTGSLIESGATVTRTARGIDPTTEESDAGHGAQIPDRVDTTSSFMMRVSKKLAEQEVGKATASTSGRGRGKSTEPQPTTAKATSGTTRSKSAAPSPLKATPRKSQRKGVYKPLNIVASPSITTAGKKNVPSKPPAPPKKPPPPKKAVATKKAVEPAIYNAPKKLPPPKNPPRNAAKKTVRNPSISSRSTSQSPEKTLRPEKQTVTQIGESSGEEEQEVTPPRAALVDTTFGVNTPPPSTHEPATETVTTGGNTTFAQAGTLIHDTPSASEQDPNTTFVGSPAVLQKSAAKCSGGCFNEEVLAAITKGVVRELEEIRKKEKEAEGKKESRLSVAVNSVLKSNKEIKDQLCALMQDHHDLMEKLRMLGDTHAEKKTNVSTMINRLLPFDTCGPASDVILACDFIQMALPAIILPHIEKIPTGDINKSICQSVMLVLFSRYAIYHFIIGDCKNSTKAFSCLKRPVPASVLKVVIPAVVQLVAKKFSAKGRQTKENMKLIRSGMSDLFSNNKTTFLSWLNDYCKDTKDLFKALYLGDKIFFESNRHLYGDDAEFISEREHVATLLQRESHRNLVAAERNGYIKPEGKVPFAPPEEAILNVRKNIGTDAMTVREAIQWIFDVVEVGGKDIRKIKFEKIDAVPNLDEVFADELKKRLISQGEGSKRQQIQQQQPEVQQQQQEPLEQQPGPSRKQRTTNSVKNIKLARKMDMASTERTSKSTSGSSSAGQMVIDEEQQEDEVFDDESPTAKRKRIQKIETNRKKKKVDEESATETDDEGEMSSGETSEEGQDDAYLQEATEEVEEDSQEGEEEGQHEGEVETGEDNPTSSNVPASHNEPCNDPETIPTSQAQSPPEEDE